MSLKNKLLVKKKIGVIGLGNMGTALVAGILAGKLMPIRNVFGCDADAKARGRARRRFGIKVFADAVEVVSMCDVILLAVKPQGFDSLAAALRGKLPARALVISIMAGVPSAVISSKLGGGLRIVRAMPNAPALLGAGMTAYSRGRKAAKKDAALAGDIFNAVGRTIEVKEPLMDLVTGLSGSGPAYFFLMIEALAAAGVGLGLKRAAAELLAAQTALGAAKMVAEKGANPAALRARVTSRGGTTQAGLEVLAKGDFKRLIHDTVKAATRRAKELGREIK